MSGRSQTPANAPTTCPSGSLSAASGPRDPTNREPLDRELRHRAAGETGEVDYAAPSADPGRAAQRPTELLTWNVFWDVHRPARRTLSACANAFPLSCPLPVSLISHSSGNSGCRLNQSTGLRRQLPSAVDSCLAIEEAAPPTKPTGRRSRRCQPAGRSGAHGAMTRCGVHGHGLWARGARHHGVGVGVGRTAPWAVGEGRTALWTVCRKCVKSASLSRRCRRPAADYAPAAPHAADATPIDPHPMSCQHLPCLHQPSPHPACTDSATCASPACAGVACTHAICGDPTDPTCSDPACLDPVRIDSACAACADPAGADPTLASASLCRHLRC
mmetsp:Transcript_48089/g.108334  ORF Transcript_48089/g.108334 Transcript_48089/m.108334 type:complete len:331 (-) Transcript_48089:327-1319(-)